MHYINYIKFISPLTSILLIIITKKNIYLYYQKIGNCQFLILKTLFKSFFSSYNFVSAFQFEDDFSNVLKELAE